MDIRGCNILIITLNLDIMQLCPMEWNGLLLSNGYVLFSFYVSFYFILRRNAHLLYANNVVPNQTPRFTASDLGLH